MHDIIIVGGGPAGLTTAIKAGTEGRSALVLERGPLVGGRPVQSPLIENVPGWPEGISGPELFGRMEAQARKFGADIVTGAEVEGVIQTSEGLRVMTADDSFAGRSVVLTMGEVTPRLDALQGWEGRGVDYACDAAQLHKHAGQHVVLIGGGNSCAQLALSLAETDARSVTILTRSPLLQTTSLYLRRRIAESRVVVKRGETYRAEGGSVLKRLKIESPRGTRYSLKADQAYVFISGVPPTGWFAGAKNEQGYILTGADVPLADPFETQRPRLPQESSMSGVFVAGDIRAGNTGGITVAFGEGTQAFQHIHRTYLPEYTTAPVAVLT